MKIADTVKYEGDNNTLVYKHPCEDFNALTQLVVHESQEAIFFVNGQALDLFTAGRYTLVSENLPLIGKALKRATGDTSPFHCEVYFINKAILMAMKWGTDSRVQYIEPTYGFPLSIGASGELALRVENARKLLLKLVGTEQSFTREGVLRYFRALLMMKVKSYIAKEFTEGHVSVFDIDSSLESFSLALKERLVPDFAEYGIALEEFFVTTVMRPEGERQYETFKALYFRQYADVAEAKLQKELRVITAEADAERLLIDSRAQAEKRRVEGYTYQIERGYDVAEKMAANDGAGQFTSMGVGLGTMAAVGSVVGGVVGDAIGGVNHVSEGSFCENCGTKLAAGASFCEECGSAVSQFGTCKGCGFCFTHSGKFCPKCGTKRKEE
ncbi:MAG: SPFH domain-containing protein [Clostridia bacterium]|nr:SPFH domain-containing protein [Clostridia bacterium]